MSSSFSAEFHHRGAVLVPASIDGNQIGALKDALRAPELSRSERGGAIYGIRNLLGLPAVREAACAPAIAARLTLLMGAGFRPVRGIFFDKTANANWPVPWHQDLSVAVRKSHDVAGWTNWSVKRGAPHAQPPSEILGRMVTVRLHLDDCPADNGALRIVPGSHLAGLLSRKSIQSVDTEPQTIVARAGDALFMRPLILHASSPSGSPSHRRVLHLEFAPEDVLPDGLE